MRTFQGHADLVTSVFLSADGRWALSASSDATLRLWEVSTGRLEALAQTPDDDRGLECLVETEWEKRLLEVAIQRVQQRVEPHV